MKGYSNYDKLLDISDVLGTLEDKSLEVQLDTLSYVSESLLVITHKEGLSLDVAEIKEINVAAEVSGLFNIAKDTTKAVVNVAWKAVKAILKAMVKVTLAVHEMGVKLTNKLEMLIKSRRKRLMRLNKWFKGGGNKKVRKYIVDAVRYRKNIGDMKSFAFYIDETDKPGRWKGKITSYALGDTGTHDSWDEIVAGNEETLVALLDDHSKLYDMYALLHDMEIENNKANRVLFKRHFKKPGDVAVHEARDFKEDQKKILRDKVSEAIDRIGDDMSIGNFSVSSKDEVTFSTHDYKTNNYKQALQTPMVIPVLDAVSDKIDKFAAIQKNIRDAQKKVLDSDRRISEKTHNTQFAKIMIQESHSSAAYMARIYVVLLRVYKEISRLYLKILKTHIKTVTKIYNVEYSLKVTRFRDHVLEPIGNVIAKTPGNSSSNKLKKKTKL